MMNTIKLFLRRMSLALIIGCLTMTGTVTVVPTDAWAQQISQSQAASIASRATGGQVLSVDKRGSVWRVKVLIKGTNVRTVSVDAQTGQVR